MLSGGDDISNDIITLGTCFSMFVYISSRSFLLLVDWQKSDSSVDGEPQENWRRNSNSRDVDFASSTVYLFKHGGWMQLDLTDA